MSMVMCGEESELLFQSYRSDMSMTTVLHIEKAADTIIIYLYVVSALATPDCHKQQKCSKPPTYWYVCTTLTLLYAAKRRTGHLLGDVFFFSLIHV